MLSLTMDSLYAAGEAATDMLSSYGWYMLGLVVLYGAFRHRIEAAYVKWRRRRDQYAYSAKYHKDSELARSRHESLLASREKLQLEHDEKAAIAEQKRIEREEAKVAERREAISQNKSGVYTLRADYLPLAGSSGSGGYKPTKRSCCKKGGGCG